ncbi:DUF2911 domain-containing protein [Tellurirhabdus bombi]|uniref:DUF2911 domain-containing protein n=1 Tax=Tellurirhabdus bombi TaxID=2907205 RepID=UPI001F2D572B|nr:DUF2911 domain-containing protein [Tellurirhabdus bombi]
MKNYSKNLMTLTLTLLMGLFCIQSMAQEKAPPASPPATAKQTVGSKTITIDYSQPSVKGRDIWNAEGKLAPYGQVWRTGANATTTIDFSDDVKVEGKSVPKGKYGLFTIPGQKEWVIIINKGIKWGAYTYKQEEDVVRVTVPAKKAKSFQEKFTIDISKKGVVSLMWADAQADFTVK